MKNGDIIELLVPKLTGSIRANPPPPPELEWVMGRYVGVTSDGRHAVERMQFGNFVLMSNPLSTDRVRATIIDGAAPVPSSVETATQRTVRAFSDESLARAAVTLAADMPTMQTEFRRSHFKLIAYLTEQRDVADEIERRKKATQR